MRKGRWTDKKLLSTAVLTRRKKGTRCWAYQTGQRNKVDGGGRRPRYFYWKHPRICTARRSQARGKTLETVNVPRNGRGRPKKSPLRSIADKGYDSEPLRRLIRVLKIDPIVPHRRSRKRPKMQDARKLRRYRKCWIIERTLAWLGNQ